MMPRRLWYGLLTLTALRWVVAGATELTADEALVWLAGEQAALGFFEHGPVASWLARAGTALAGDTALGVRLWAPLAMLGASWFGWRLATSAFGDKAGGWFLTAMQLTPLVNLAAVRGLPETYMFLFAMMAAWWLWQALHRASAWAWQWPAAGAALGLGVLSAPSGVLLVVGLWVLLSVPRRWRGRWRRPGPWLALVAATLGAAPWVWWLRGHDWIPLASAWAGWARQAEPWAMVRWLGMAILAASPFLFAGMVWAGAQALSAAWVSWRRYRDGGLSADDPLDQKNGRVFLLGLAAPGGLWLVVEAVIGREALGPAAFPGCAALMLLAAAWVDSSLRPVTHRLAQNATLLVAGAYSLLALHSDFGRHLGVPWPYRLDPTAGARGWRETAAQTAAAQRALASATGPSRPVFLLADTPELAAAIGFYLPDNVHLPESQATRLRCHLPARLAVDSDFSFWAGYADEPSWAGLDALFVSEAAEPAALELLSHQFERLERLGSLDIRRGRWPVRTVSFFTCRSWRGPAR